MQHLLHVQGEHQEHREDRRAEDQSGDVCADDRPQPEDRERHERLGAAPLPADKGCEQGERSGEERDRLERAPAVVVCLRDRVHERDEPAGDEHGAGQIEGLDACVAALGQEQAREREPEQADRHVDEEDPLPAQCARQDTAEQDAGNRAEGADPAPGAEGGVSFLPLGEGRHQDRERGRSDQRRTEPLEPARADQ